ncbi:hypothetical protein GJQ54_01635 [Oceanospirillaceae bacterium ASx5O]|nr:hypothetical protein GJQ54_01635 [Oceanospirillaceae bacterium ASx5O]
MQSRYKQPDEIDELSLTIGKRTQPKMLDKKPDYYSERIKSCAFTRQRQNGNARIAPNTENSSFKINALASYSE